MKAAACGLVGALIVWKSFVMAEAGTLPETSLPRFKFEVGQELVYAGSSKFEYENGSHESTDRVTLWVTRKNGDGGWHLVAHSENTFAQHFGRSSSNTPHIDKRQTFGEFDVKPDGAVLNAPEGYHGQGLTAMIFKLPANSQELESGWIVEKDGGTERSLYRVAKVSDGNTGSWVIERSEAGLFSVIYVSTSRALVHFDADRGFISKIVMENSQGYGFNGKGAGSVELKSATKRDPEWLEQLAKEAAVFSEVQRAIMGAGTADNDVAGQDSRYAQAEKILREGKEKVQLPLVVAQFAEQEKQLGESRKYSERDKQKEDSVLNKEAAEWSTTDLDGANHSMAGYRGKVVVLDFWYRGCGWCIKAMPQIKELVEQYRGKPVAVLGMNTDQKDEDARFVIEKLELNYATLKAKGLPEKFGVQGFPTLVVIDQKGIVRKRHVGYSPKLRQDLVEVIDGLLKETK